ncbi:MAG: hypothetical protein O2954_07465 [bacterium]|nr:hypothetical protein [bacterium]
MPPLGTLQAKTWLAELKTQTPRILARLQEIYGHDPDILEPRHKLYVKALETFIQAYGEDREVLISRAPGRINLLGNHIDHRGGYVNYMAINRDTLMVASAREDDRVEMCNANTARFPACSFHIGQALPPHRRGNWLHFIEQVEIQRGNWANYAQAAVLHLQDRFPDRPLKGMDLAVTGDVPIAAGLSSSSTLVVTTLETALAFNSLEIPFKEKAEFCGTAEWYVGTRGGAGDHAAMLYARRQAVLPLRFFPLQISEVPFPAGYRVAACNSFVEHAPPGIFNERIATYEIGLLLVRNGFPQCTSKLERLRDLNAEHLGISLSEIYRILKTLPERMSRTEIRAQLPDHTERLETLFSPHPEPQEGYRVRQVVLFGLAECARGALCSTLLQNGDLEGFGKLKYLSHNGDRRFTFTADGKALPGNNRIPNEELDRLIADLESGDPIRKEAAQIHLQPGGYDCSCEELDILVDLARSVDGVVGAGLAGGGLGGCVLVVVQENSVDHLIEALNAGFYGPRGLSNGTLVCASVAGSGLV